MTANRRRAPILRASLESRTASVYATLVIALAIVPVFFLEQVAGAFFPSAAFAYLLGLLAALVVALTVTPALSVLLLSRKSVGSDDSPPVRRLQSGYQAGLSRIMARRLPLFLGAALLLIAGAVSLASMGSSVLPSLKESQVLIQWEATPGTSLPEMNRITARAAAELRALPGVSQLGAHVGRAVTSDQAVGVNSGELWATIDPDADYGRTIASIKSVMNGYPGFSSHVGAYSTDKVSDLLTGTKETRSTSGCSARTCACSRARRRS